MSDEVDFTKYLLDKDNNPYRPTVLFTEDGWNTVWEGICIGSSPSSYLVQSKKYGTFWISKTNVILK